MADINTLRIAAIMAVISASSSADDASNIVDGFRSIDKVLKIFNFFDDMADPEIQRLLDQREAARSEKNWALADEIRAELKSRGIIVQDQK